MPCPTHHYAEWVAILNIKRKCSSNLVEWGNTKPLIAADIAQCPKTNKFGPQVR